MAVPHRAGPFRGLAPFTEADGSRLFGRDELRKRLQQQLRGHVPLTLITGDSGVGKTSLVRASLVPMVRAEGMTPIYADMACGWELMLAAALSQRLGRRPAGPDDLASSCLELAQADGAPTLLVFDHIEQLVWLDEQRLSRLNHLLGVLLSRPDSVSFALVTDRSDLHVLGNLALERRVPQDHRVIVDRLDPNRACDVIERTILAGGGYMEAGLPKLITQELSASGTALPADIQRVCHAAVARRLVTVNAYRRAGGAEALSSAYVECLAAQARGWGARRALATLAESDNPRQALPLDHIAHRAGLAESVARPLLERLVDAGLLSRAPVSAGVGQRYAILHPQLQQSVRDLVGSVRRGRSRARQALRIRLDTKGLLRPLELYRVWRYLGGAISDRERFVTTRAAWFWGPLAAVFLALPLLCSLLLWARLATTHYLDASNVGGSRSAVLRSGDPKLHFAFGASYGRIEVDTGFVIDTLPGPLVDRIEHGRLKGRLTNKRHGLPGWLAELLAPLSAARKGALLLLAGKPELGTQLLLRAIEQGHERERATRLLVQLAPGSAASRRALMMSARDDRPEVRKAVARQAQQLGGPSARSVLALLKEDADPQVRLGVLKASAELDPRYTVAWLGRWVSDNDERVRRAALDRLQALLKREPIAAFDALVAARIAARTAKARDGKTIDPELNIFATQLQRRLPKQLAQHVIRRLQASDAVAERRVLMEFLVALAPHLDETVANVIASLTKDKDSRVRELAVGLQARFTPAEATFEQLKALAKNVSASPASRAGRRSAALGLRLVKAPSTERLKLLERLLVDHWASIREAAISSMLRLGGSALHVLLDHIGRGYPADASRVVLETLCGGGQASARTVRSVVSAVWNAGSTAVRAEVLRCAGTLAATTSGIAVWLADAAASSPSAVIRRAAAIPVALSVTARGRAMVRLPRYYLFDGDASVRAAVLRELAQCPPSTRKLLVREGKRMLKDPTVTVRVAAVKFVAAASTAATAARWLAKMLDDHSARVRRVVVKALLALGTQNADELAANSWKTARAALDPGVTRLVMQATGTVAANAVALAVRLQLQQTLHRAVTHPDADVRAMAIGPLGRLVDPAKAAAVFDIALRDEELVVRLSAIRAVGAQSERLGTAASKLLARSAAAATNADEQVAVFDALGGVDGAALAPALALVLAAAQHPSEQRRVLAMHALGHLSLRAEQAVDALIDGALDPAHDVRKAARAALVQYLGQASDRRVLWALLCRSRRNAVLRHVVAAALVLQERRLGGSWLRQKVAEMDHSVALPTRMVAQLAAAVVPGEGTSPEVFEWLWGWQ